MCANGLNSQPAATQLKRHTAVRFVTSSSSTLQIGRLMVAHKTYVRSLYTVQQKNARIIVAVMNSVNTYLHVPYWLEIVYLDFQRPHLLFFTINLGAYASNTRATFKILDSSWWLTLDFCHGHCHERNQKGRLPSWLHITLRWPVM